MILLPLGPEKPSRRPPFVTWGIIAACVVVWAASSVSGVGALVTAFGLVPAQPAALSWVAHIFVHGGVGHLLGNLLFLWVFGPNVEAAMGRTAYLVAFLVLGAAAAFTHAVSTALFEVPLIGASGAISSLIGLHTALFPLARLRVLYFVWWGVGGRSGMRPVPLVWFVALWVVEQAFWLWLDRTIGAEMTVAFSAHLGGFFAGLLAGIAWVTLVPGWYERADLVPSVGEAERIRTLLVAAADNLRAGYPAAARRSVAKVLRIDPTCRLPPDLQGLRHVRPQRIPGRDAPN
jgi:membrane associated rhomboid family serine protease